MIDLYTTGLDEPHGYWSFSFEGCCQTRSTHNNFMIRMNS
jgi:hypothetical protein